MEAIGTAKLARIRAIGIDTVQVLSDAFISILKADPAIEYVARYLDTLTPEEVSRIHAADLSILPLTYANEFDPAPRLQKLAALGCPQSVTTVLDVESVHLAPADTIARVNAWARAFKSAQFDPGGYVGAGSGLMAAEWTQLAVDRYVLSCSIVPEPSEGYAVLQLFPPNQHLGDGLVVDWQVAQHDYEGRSVMLWAP
jgi:hypothetical protein